MSAFLTFSVTLVGAMLLSEVAHRTVLSASVLFLAVGIATGPEGAGWIRPDSSPVETLAHYALVSVLYTDGMKLGLRELRDAWRLPGRALLFGMPLVTVFTAVAAHALTGLGWMESFLIGAILSPTDPVLAAAVVGRREMPQRLRMLLNVESGVNDALALPVVVLLMGMLAHESSSLWRTLPALGGGVLIGVTAPLMVFMLERLPRTGVLPHWRALFVLSVGLLVVAVTEATHANDFLAAFTAGVTVAAARPDLCEAFQGSGENISELLKLGTLLAFGALISFDDLASLGIGGHVFAAIALLAVRPLAVAIAMARSELRWPEVVTAGWFGPKGFASMVFAILALHADIPAGEQVYHLAALVIAGSVVLHSTTDVPVAHWFRGRQSSAAKPG